MVSLSDLLKSQRLRLKMTREEVAGDLEVTTSTVGHWERGDRVPDVVHLAGLARVLKLDRGRLTELAEQALRAKRAGRLLEAEVQA